jgi:hypothetical protein
LKDSLLKNNYLKNISLKNYHDFEKTDILNNEFHLVYKLIQVTQNNLSFWFTGNNYFSNPNINLRLNFLKSFIDEINYLFYNFHIYDIKFRFL